MKIRVLRGYKYELVEGEKQQTNILELTVLHKYIRLYSDGEIIIVEGYAWDGSTCSFDKNSLRASLVHDALYQLMREGLLHKKYRKQADQLYRDMLIEDGLWKIHANLRYWALRNFAGGGIKPEKKPRGKIIEIGE